MCTLEHCVFTILDLSYSEILRNMFLIQYSKIRIILSFYYLFMYICIEQTNVPRKNGAHISHLFLRIVSVCFERFDDLIFQAYFRQW